jgi:hypothetical protein
MSIDYQGTGPQVILTWIISFHAASQEDREKQGQDKKG